MKLRFCGVRGSTPAPGEAFVRTGGHTSCIAVTPAGASSPTLVLDAGTGIRNVTALLDGDPFRGTIMLTHLHWDHVQGLPFFGGADRDDARTDVLLPAQATAPAEAIARAMSPPHFPIGPEGLRGTWSFASLAEGEHEIEGFGITAREIPHKGGRTFGYRITDGRHSFAYLPDHDPTGTVSPEDAATSLARGVDLLVHDAQFLASEASLAQDYGHATVDQAMALAIGAGAGELALFHHSPSRSDDEIDAIVEDLRADPTGIVVRAAIEGEERDL